MSPLIRLLTIALAVGYPSNTYAAQLTGRADPFKPLIQPKRELPPAPFPVMTPEIRPLAENLPIERPVIPELVGIIADPQGAVAALKLNHRVELLQAGQRKGDVKVISIQSPKVVVSIRGKITELSIDRSNR